MEVGRKHIVVEFYTNNVTEEVKEHFFKTITEYDQAIDNLLEEFTKFLRKGEKVECEKTLDEKYWFYFWKDGEVINHLGWMNGHETFSHINELLEFYKAVVVRENE